MSTAQPLCASVLRASVLSQEEEGLGTCLFLAPSAGCPKGPLVPCSSTRRPLGSSPSYQWQLVTWWLHFCRKPISEGIFPWSLPVLRQLRKALRLIYSSPGSLAFLSSYISKDTLPPAGGGKQGQPQTFSICCLKSTTFCSWGSQATQQEMYWISNSLIPIPAHLWSPTGYDNPVTALTWPPVNWALNLHLAAFFILTLSVILIAEGSHTEMVVDFIWMPTVIDSSHSESCVEKDAESECNPQEEKKAVYH